MHSASTTIHRNRHVFASAAAAILFAGLLGSALGADVVRGRDTIEPVAGALTPQQQSSLINSALSAAPTDLAGGASVAIIDAGGQLAMLRHGTNGITCMPDDPATPGNDPQCADGNALQLLGALSNGTALPTSIGIAYLPQSSRLLRAMADVSAGSDDARLVANLLEPGGHVHLALMIVPLPDDGFSMGAPYGGYLPGD